jgi:hypothetical protein
MLIKILIVLAVAFIGLIVFAAMRPSEFRVVRSALVGAPPDAVFPHVNDLHNWEAWSPWAKVDPAAKTIYEGPAAGVGAAFSWAGNHNIGEGRMTITESQPNDFVRFRLDFLKPFKGTNSAEFTFQPEGGQTRVTWTMSGHYSFVPKLMGLFINCDKMVGDQFEKGLADLNKVAGTLVRN